MTYRKQLWDIAVDHHGIVTTSQAADVDIPAVELRKLASRGALAHVARGVYRHLSAPADKYTELATAVAAAGTTAFLEKETVLGMHGLALVNPQKIRVGDLRRNRVRPSLLVEIEHRKDLGPADVTHYQAMPATSVFRALTDCMPRLMIERAEQATWEARDEGLVTAIEFEHLARALEERTSRLAMAV